MKTVNEIGVSFVRSNVCYLGEIILEQKRRHLHDIILAFWLRTFFLLYTSHQVVLLTKLT
ncbi:hypothetical protein E2986_11411 [Frieseomelitta varia]|uniref:Uncharacterized protein n=1 Tax=Frieseomelitta varia TaxID=561572 RepID=A0A833S9T6_9HYME|nr:hypothetical protein E2986_11411 [Frieseomelitta varia]